MDHSDWIILQVLSQYKNITKTAEKLYISQPALSNRIKQIEKEFGVNVIIRGRNGVQLTPEGEYLAQKAENVLSLHQDISEGVINMSKNVIGTLRIASSNAFTRYKLPAILKSFESSYPNIKYKISTGLSKNVLQQIYNQDVHIGFVRGNYDWNGEKLLLFQETLCAASREEFDLTTLPKMQRIDYNTDILLRIDLENWWRRNFNCPPIIKMEVDRVETARELVLNGLGYAILPSLLLQGADDLYKINITNEYDKPLLRETWMYYSLDSLKLNNVRAFIEFVKELADSKQLGSI